MAHQKKKLKLYSYWRSSYSYCIRIALNLKGLEYQYIPVNLLKREQFSPKFQKLNPIGYVLVLVDGDIIISDSFAIFMYLEEKYPQHLLLLSNIGKKKNIEEKISPNDVIPWVKSQIEKGFKALEKLLKDHAGRYAIGDEVFMADVFLAPQIHVGIKRFKVYMGKFLLLSRLNDAYGELPQFQNVMPENQPNTPLA